MPKATDAAAGDDWLGVPRHTFSAVLGAVIIVIAMVLVLPIALFVGGALWSALLGSALAAERPPAEPEPDAA